MLIPSNRRKTRYQQNPTPKTRSNQSPYHPKKKSFTLLLLQEKRNKSTRGLMLLPQQHNPTEKSKHKTQNGYFWNLPHRFWTKNLHMKDLSSMWKHPNKHGMDSKQTQIQSTHEIMSMKWVYSKVHTTHIGGATRPPVLAKLGMKYEVRMKNPFWAFLFVAP
jgi:hypothetical protein